MEYVEIWDKIVAMVASSILLAAVRQKVLYTRCACTAGTHSGIAYYVKTKSLGLSLLTTHKNLYHNYLSEKKTSPERSNPGIFRVGYPRVKTQRV
jgi:hypothetical protein